METGNKKAKGPILSSIRIKELIRKSLLEGVEIKKKISVYNLDQIISVIELTIESLNKGGKVLLCGNGGSAADAQHLAAEFVGRFKKNRVSLPAVALTTDTSILTAVGNDFGFNQIFARQVEALGKKEDILYAFSTSGNSRNVILAIESAKKIGLTTIGFLGKGGGEAAEKVDIAIVVPSDNTPRIQEEHITIGHIIFEAVENYLFENV